MALWGPDMIKLSLTLLFPYSLQNIIFSSSSFMQTRDPQFVALNFTHHLYSNAAVLTSDAHSRTWSSLWSSLYSPDSEAYASSLGAGRAAPFSLRHSFSPAQFPRSNSVSFFPKPHDITNQYWSISYRLLSHVCQNNWKSTHLFRDFIYHCKGH